MNVTFDRLEFRDHALEAVLRSEHGDVGRALAKKAIQAVGHAKRFAPVDTGYLRSSITWELRVDSAGVFAVIGSGVEYAAYVEFGTRFMAAQPYLRPAIRLVA